MLLRNVGPLSHGNVMRNLGNANNEWKMDIKESKGRRLINEQKVMKVSLSDVAQGSAKVFLIMGGCVE